MLRARLATVIGLLALAGCGQPGDTSSSPCGLCGDMNDIRGSIATKTGSQAAMAGWALASFERDTGIARVSEIDAAGLYTLGHVRTDAPQTLALFTPDYILQAVLSLHSDTPNTIHQFFKMNSAALPQLINNGKIITFQNENGISPTKELASDQNGDGIPDGTKSIGGPELRSADDRPGQGFFLQQAVPQDTDLDGTYNHKDPDIDGDGIINWLDPDDNGNVILDVFDGDANSDLVADRDEQLGDLYFTEGVEWIAVQFELSPKADDNSTFETTLKFTCKVRENVAPNAVQIRGAPSLLNASTYIANDANGQPTVQAWNRLLQDDGVSEDQSAGDRLFAKKVVLPDAKAPRAHEAIFFQLVFGTAEAPYYIEYPYIFPDLKPTKVTAQYDTTTKTVLLVGSPFGEVQDFVWTITVWDENNKAIWTSQAVPGSTRQFKVQDNILVAGQTYKYSVAAQSLDKIQGYPSYVINSIKYDLK